MSPLLDQIVDRLTAVGPAADEVRDVIHRASGVGLLRMSDATPSADPVIAARSAAQYALAMLWSSQSGARDEAIDAFISSANEVFAQLNASGATVVGTIYFIRQSGRPEVKIGYATSWPTRRTALQTAMPAPIEVLALIHGTMSDEAALHQKFAHLRISTNLEWFHPGDDLLDHIRRISRIESAPP